MININVCASEFSLIIVLIFITIRCLRWEAGLSSIIMVCALAFKPTYKVEKSDIHKSLSQELRSLVNIDIWKNAKYVIWATMIPLALFGYFVPYVHLVRMVFEICISILIR